MRKKQKKLQLNRTIIVFLFVLMLIIFSFLISKTLSKYEFIKQETHIQESTQFYFESNLLKEEEKIYKINNWSGNKGETQIIQFDIRNYTNNLLKSESDILYNITTNVLNNEDNIISVNIKNSANEIISDDNICTIKAENGFITEDYTLEILANEQIANGRVFEIELVVNSISPYTKTLKTKIIVEVNRVENYETALTNSSNGEYAVLNIKVYEPQKNITIQYDKLKLILDKSACIVNDLLVTEDTLNSFTIPKEKLEKGKSYDIYFVKLQEDIILGTDIKVE